MSTTPAPGPMGDEVALIRRLVLGGVLFFVALIFGYLGAHDYVLPLALLAGCCGLYLLFVRPFWFLLVALFFFYQALDIVDTDTFGHVAGLFRLKDLCFVLLVAHAIAGGILDRQSRLSQAGTLYYLPFLLFVGWLVFQFLRTVYILGDEPLLSFRAGRHFLTYLLFLLIPVYVTTDRDWATIFKYLHVLAFFSISLAFLTAAGYSPSFFALTGRYSAAGVLKFWSPGESIVYFLFVFDFWRLCLRPTKQRAALLLLMGIGVAMFVFRARLAGTALGILAGVCFVANRIRFRVFLAGICVLTAAVVFLSALTLIAPTAYGGNKNYVVKFVDYFKDAAEGIVYGKSDAILIRTMFMQERLPIIKEHPFAGLGFVSPFGTVAWKMYKTGVMPMGHVDVGWLDSLLRLGSIGSFLLALFLFASAWQASRILKRYDLTVDEQVACLTTIAFVVLMFASLYSFSYPTYEPAITSFSILLAWVYHIFRKYQKVSIAKSATGVSEAQGARLSNYYPAR